MTIKDLLDSGIEIQGKYCIKKYDGENDKYILIKKGDDFQYEYRNENYLNASITFMYVENGYLNIEIEL